MFHKILLALVVVTCMLSSAPAFTAGPDSLLAILDTVPRNEAKVKTLNELFRAHLQTNPVKAVGFAREALNLATEINDRKGLAAAYNNLGVAYKTQGALDKALEYYLTSLHLYEALQNKEGIATTRNNIATIYSMKKDYGQAMKYLQESYKLFIELKDEDKIIGSMNNLGNLHSEIQLYEKAMDYFSQAYQLSEKKGQAFADPLTNIGNLYFRQNNYQRAVENYEKALQLERQNNNTLGALNILINLGITYTKAKQPKPAQVYLDEAARLCQELQAFSYLPSIYKTASENYSNQGQWKEAYDTYVKYDEAREKIYGEESSRKIAQMEMLIDFQEKEKELDLLKSEDEITRLELRSTQLVVVLIILAVLTVLGGLNLFLRKKMLK
ncbi:tetratricopeptide repeat protein [Parachryseolinea silvisoli]|uniref:tetratricopeptide repeat protein n=1 Tax=Parachryseolinea silvisoli TaxID=2873601 RepID=UPI002265DE9B|nr:tetratricopeptide repeat protein [Parachryseolinea silvisoli]MCD9013884.1 tetratricopeptide repeat protein [Parachryseolinea silvisoli]